MVFLFRDKSDINLLFLLVLSVLLHFDLMFSPPVVVANPADGLLAFLLVNYIKPLPPVFLIGLFHFIILTQAIRLNVLFSQYKMFPIITYLPAFTYILLTALFPYWAVISAGLIANYLIIWILVKLFRLYDQSQPKSLEFNIGLILGVSILLYEPIAIFIPVVLFALTIIRAFKLTEWLVMLMGVLLPFYFLFTYVFLTGSPFELPSFLTKLVWQNPLQKMGIKLLLILAFLGIQLLLGGYFWRIQNSRFIIQVRKYWGVMLLVLFLTLFQPIIFSSQSLYASAIVITPLAGFISFAYTSPKQLLIPNVLFWVGVSLIVYKHFA